MSGTKVVMELDAYESTTNGHMTITNHTDKPLKITMTVAPNASEMRIEHP